MAWNNLIPFDSKGNMMEYAHPNWAIPMSWKENCIFNATMKIYDYSRGRSSVKFILEDRDTRIRYQMFITDFIDVIRSKSLFDGVLNADWTFVKRGANYGIKLASGIKQNDPREYR